ncbi:hypothetical protein G7K_1803-t1 [Saitoella complicata NRRL Y-17804]|uniref:Uncharacterized protein n=1 Tax=Saitoella complicata (strain BCRC 22490 / CBS 7301 / JCM 7358 / NBRC 10748 / NRRL Y-17804) TaxID=698492 RepID=A0A0E9NCS7_SAICN|nr:hypothetical protein G7K_1803-t1 [Saitoella complicata NRRL Y-17804]
MDPDFSDRWCRYGKHPSCNHIPLYSCIPVVSANVRAWEPFPGPSPFTASGSPTKITKIQIITRMNALSFAARRILTLSKYPDRHTRDLQHGP